MKNVTKRAASLKSLLKKLIRKHKPGDPPQLEPLRALVLGLLREDADEKHVEKAIARFDAEFVDINELRVATELELAELMGKRFPAVEDRAGRLRQVLMAIFDAEGQLALGRIEQLPRAEQRQASGTVPGMTPYAAAHMCLFGFGHGAAPVDGTMLRYLADQGVVEPETSVEDGQRFVEQHLKVDEAWPFFAVCRAEAYAAPAPRRRRSAKAAAAKKPRVTKKTTRRKSAPRKAVTK